MDKAAILAQLKQPDDPDMADVPLAARVELFRHLPPGVLSAPTIKLVEEVVSVIEAGDLQESRSGKTALNVLIRQMQERVAEDFARVWKKSAGGQNQKWLEEWLNEDPARWEMSGSEIGKEFGMSASQVNRLKKKIKRGA